MADRPRPTTRTVDGRLKIAPTAVKVYSPRLGGCPRRWAFEKIGGLRYERGTGQTDGHDAHGELELHLKGVRPPDQTSFAGRLAAVLVPVLPPSITEEYVIVDTGSPLWVFHGYVDGSAPGEVWDAKFYAATSKEWMLTADDLYDDPQAAIYCAAKSAPRFTMHYVIKPRDRENGVGKHAPVSIEWTPDRLCDALAELDRIALQMLWHMVHTTNPNTVPHAATTACDGTGYRCPYVAHCRLHEPGLPTPWSITQ